MPLFLFRVLLTSLALWNILTSAAHAFNVADQNVTNKIVQGGHLKPNEPSNMVSEQTSSTSTPPAKENTIQHILSMEQKNIIQDFSERIRGKIRSKLFKNYCDNGNPVIAFDIQLAPTGEISGHPEIRKSSGSKICDGAVADAIWRSSPLPVPSEPELFDYFRRLHLVFKPNE